MLTALDSDELTDLINKHRVERSQNVLLFCENLNRSSKIHLDYLLNSGVISHQNSDSGSLINRTADSGVTGLYSGEIVGYASSIKELISLWMESPEHKSVILDPKWNWIGGKIIKWKDVYVSVINFSSGQLGSVENKYTNSGVKIVGSYIGQPRFNSKKDMNIKLENGFFELSITSENRVFFIYVYSENGNLTDQINIF